jgi:glycosyltransferase involved in cell wall biosynthesis
MSHHLSEINRISIVIPNLNNAESLKQCLIALNGQSFGRDKLEIIVVDNGSSDNSLDIAKMYADIVLQTETKGNPYIARNLGIKNASYPYVGLLDSKSIPSSDTIKLLINRYRKGDLALVSGNVIFTLSQPPVFGEWLDALIFVRIHEIVKAKTGLPGNSFWLFHQSLIDQIGHFREDMRSGADGEWSMRIWDLGRCIDFEPNAIVYYRARSFWPLMKKARRTGLGYKKFARLRPGYNPFKWRLNTLLRMRPASSKYLEYCLQQRIQTEKYPFSLLRLSLGVWIYRIFHSVGRFGI